jgi:hypothetical protein
MRGFPLRGHEEWKVKRFYLDPEYRVCEACEIPLKLKTFVPRGVNGCANLFNLLIFGVLAFVFGYMLIEDIWSNFDYRFNGIDAVADVSHCERFRRQGKPDYWELQLSYTYHTPQGNFQGEEMFMDDRLCSDLPSRISIRYLSYKPIEARITDSTLVPTILTTLGFSVLIWSAALIGIFGFGFLIYQNWLLIVALIKRPRLQAKGVLLEGELIQIEPYIEGEQHFLVAEYRFASPTGRKRQGKQTAEREDLRGKNLPLPGTPVTVLYADDQTYVML